MSEFGISHYKRALLYDQITAQQVNNNPIIDPFANTQGQQFQQPPSRYTKAIALAVGVVAILHFSVWYAAKHLPTQPLEEKKPKPVVIEIVKPKEEPSKIIEPKIPPVTKKPEIPPVQQKPQQVAKPIEKPQPPKPKVAESKPIEQKPVETKAVAEPVVAKPVAAEPVTPKPEATPAPVEKNLPVTEAKGYAGYLSNPAPEYPEVALERGWEGSVVLRVKVSPSGSPVSIDIKKGSGKKALDDAAVRTVKRWKFSPALRGSTPVEGWVDVPINFQLPA